MGGALTDSERSDTRGYVVYSVCLRGRSCLTDSERSDTRGCVVYSVCLRRRSCLTDSERSDTCCVFIHLKSLFAARSKLYTLSFV